MNTPLLLLAETSGRPLFGNQWLALLVVLAGVAVLMVAIAAVGRWLAATHPDTPATPASSVASPAPVPPTPLIAVPAAVAMPGLPDPQCLAAIAAALGVILGEKARIVAIRTPAPPPNVETLMQQWSLEGRRQIYTSHQLR